MAVQKDVSSAQLEKKVGQVIDVLVDEVDEDGAIARSKWDAPEIDGNVFLNGELDVKVGDLVRVKVVEAGDYDLWAERFTADA
jgi:ribosomal protein S12 methylthiotransferase